MYEVDLRYHESVSLLNNIRNHLITQIFKTVCSYFFDNLSITWTGVSANVLFIQGLELESRGNYETLLNDMLFLRICSMKNRGLKITRIGQEVIELIREKTQLKYVDNKNLEVQLNKLEASGDLRPNMDNNQGFTGIRHFDDLNYFKLYDLSDCYLKNCSYISKDAEDKFLKLGLEIPWKEPLCDHFHSLLEGFTIKVDSYKQIKFELGSSSEGSVREKVIKRHLSAFMNPRRDMRLKFIRGFKAISQKIESTRKIVKWVHKKYLSLFRDRVDYFKAKHIQDLSLRLFNKYAHVAHAQAVLMVARNLVLASKTVQRLDILLRKMSYMTKLTLKAESFYTVKRKVQFKYKHVRSFKMAESFFNLFYQAKYISSVASSFNLIYRLSKISATCMNLQAIVDKKHTTFKEDALGEFKQVFRQKKKQEELEKFSLNHLRKNYLLNNVLFILKYHFNMQKQGEERAAFNHIKKAAESKKAFQQRIKKFCERMDSTLKRRIIRVTLGSFSEYRSQATTHNYKIGFHFLELYIRRKNLRDGLLAVKKHPSNHSRCCSGCNIIVHLFQKKKMSLCFLKIAKVRDQNQGFRILQGLFDRKQQVLVRSYGKQLIMGIQAMIVLRRQRVEQRVQMGAYALNKILMRHAKTRLMCANKSNHQNVKMAAIRLELILLKAQKKAYRAGLINIHKKMVKKLHHEAQVKTAKQHKAAAHIQAFFKMLLFKNYYRHLLRSAILIQRKFRKYLKKKEENRMKIVFQIASQRKRMTQIRETAIHRLKENLTSQKSKPISQPLQLQKVQNILSKNDQVRKVEDKGLHLKEIHPNSSELYRVEKKKQAFGKENMNQAHQGKQIPSMMKLNIDSNQLQNIKMYKNKVITNHMREKEKEFTVHEQFVQSNISFNEKRATRLTENRVKDEDSRRDNLQDLISGVKSKIKQIRDTQRTTSHTNN
jgi:hypothetical protein